MEITTQSLLKMIEKISIKVDALQNELQSKNEQINILQAKNNNLVNEHNNTLKQIKDYIAELEIIRKHYANNKN